MLENGYKVRKKECMEDPGKKMRVPGARRAVPLATNHQLSTASSSGSRFNKLVHPGHILSDAFQIALKQQCAFEKLKNSCTND